MSNESKDIQPQAADTREAATTGIDEGGVSGIPDTKDIQPQAAETPKRGPGGKKPAKTQSQAGNGAGALHAVGKAACKRHGLPAVWVTADGQCFAQENDARNHGKSLGHSAEPLKVEA